MNSYDYGTLSKSFKDKSLSDLGARYPKILENVISGVSISKGSRGIPNMGGVNTGYATVVDSVVKGYWNPLNSMGQSMPKMPLIRVESDPRVVARANQIQDSLLQSGKTAEDVKKALATSVVPVMTYDQRNKQFVMHTYMKGINDSLIENSSIPGWNIGYLYNVYKQPYAPSKASRLVSVESFGNAWCDTCAIFKEAFEGWGRISNAAHGNAEMTVSNPVLNTFGIMMANVYNIMVDYQSSIAEDMAASGSPFIGQGLADREKYSTMVRQRIEDQLTYFGDVESGYVGIKQSCTPYTYAGTPLNSIYESTTNTTKGSQIVRQFIALIADKMQENHYLASKMMINVSTHVWKALTSTVYSDNYNPESPLSTITKHFAQGKDLGGGLEQLDISFEVDPMLDATVSGGNTNPFNPNAYDLTVMTIPSVHSAMGDQQGLVIQPKPLGSLILPPMYSRQGQLYTNMSRIGDIMCPIEGTVVMVEGLGYQG